MCTRVATFSVSFLHSIVARFPQPVLAKNDRDRGLTSWPGERSSAKNRKRECTGVYRAWKGKRVASVKNSEGLMKPYGRMEWFSTITTCGSTLLLGGVTVSITGKRVLPTRAHGVPGGGREGEEGGLL